MRRRCHRFVISGSAFAVLSVSPLLLMAKDGMLVVRVSPKQAYVFIDGRAIDKGNRSIRCSPGEHSITLYNYGYTSVSRRFTMNPGRSTKLSLALEPSDGEVSGPWSRIQLKGSPRNVVLLNGKTLDYFVGHVGEFSSGIIGKRELLVPPGTHTLTVLERNDNKEIFSGTIDLKPSESVVIDLDRNGSEVRKNWPAGERLKSVPRFKEGFASARVAVSPVSAEFSLTPAKLSCGEVSQLAWTTHGTVAARINGIGRVPDSGKQALQPRETSTYTLTASGPGGALERSVTVSVDRSVTASLRVTPEDAHYHRIEDRVEERGAATLTWSTSNAELVAINGLDSVDATRIGSIKASGNLKIELTPKKSDPGPVDETITYTLTASNACGGSETRSATVHISGSIEGPNPKEADDDVGVAMNSVYFPTGLPGERDASGGLVQSQRLVLQAIAGDFKKYLQFHPDAHLILQAHADPRGSPAYNRALSKRRADLVGRFLVDQGIPETNVETVALGKEGGLEEDAVKKLEEQNPNLSPKEKERILRNPRTHVLANNRRVDIVISTTGQQSYKFFPYHASDAEQILSEKLKAGVTPGRSRNRP